VSYDPATSTAVLTPTAPLANSTSYTAHLSTAQRSSDGVSLAAPVQWTFTTTAAPLIVTAKPPPDGATGGATTAALTVTFSRALDPLTVTSTSSSLTNSPGTSLSPSVSYDPATSTAALSPTAPLANGTSYSAHLSTALRSSDGVSLAAPVQWT